MGIEDAVEVPELAPVPGVAEGRIDEDGFLEAVRAGEAPHHAVEVGGHEGGSRAAREVGVDPVVEVVAVAADVGHRPEERGAVGGPADEDAEDAGRRGHEGGVWDLGVAWAARGDQRERGDEGERAEPTEGSP
ncbi:MAG: hypothetical protein P1P87_07765 [Trueperaceae bacterium]|nr:hypothetical protein [Trueperaceae bacterium]